MPKVRPQNSFTRKGLTKMINDFGHAYSEDNAYHLNSRPFALGHVLEYSQFLHRDFIAIQSG